MFFLNIVKNKLIKEEYQLLIKHKHKKHELMGVASSGGVCLKDKRRDC